jgi:3'-phosphoadenosine 5'-phosphosulfate (PAPS) 3'-phosphatase
MPHVEQSARERPDDDALAARAALARRLAGEAARLAVTRWRSGLATEAKSDTSPVTAVDRDVNDFLVSRLAAEDPGTPIVGEEGSLSGPPGGWCWFVDPIDGTGDFVTGTGQWMVLIGATYGGRPVLGVAARPAPGAGEGAPRLYWAAAGAGAFQAPLEGGASARAMRLAVSDIAHLAEARLLIGKSRHRDGFLPRLEALPHRALVRVGSLGLKASLVAEGSADAYASASLQTSLWDLVAPAAIVEEAGGRITDLTGAPLRFDADDPTWRQGVIVSNGRVHGALVSAFRPYLEETQGS